MLLRGNEIILPVRPLAGSSGEPLTEYGFDWTPRKVSLYNSLAQYYGPESHMISPISYSPRATNGLIGSYYASFYTNGTQAQDYGKMSILYGGGQSFYRDRGKTPSWQYGTAICFKENESTGLPMTHDGSTEFNCSRWYNTTNNWNKVRPVHFFDEAEENYNTQPVYDNEYRYFKSMMCDLSTFTLGKAIAYFTVLVWFNTESAIGRAAEAAFVASPTAYIAWVGKCNSDPNDHADPGYSLVPLDKQRISYQGEHNGFPAIVKVLCSKTIGGKNYYSVIVKSDVNDTVNGTTIANAETDFSVPANRSAVRGGDVPPDAREPYIVTVTDISMPYLYVGSTNDEYLDNLANWDVINMGVEYYRAI